MELIFATSVLLQGVLAVAPSLRFSAPAALPPDHGAFVDSVVGLRSSRALGCGSGFFGTLDGGKTWEIPQPCAGQSRDGLPPSWENDTTFAVLSSDGTWLHNMGDIVGAVASAVLAHGNITAISTNASTEFSVGDDGKFVAILRRAPTQNATVSITGIPTPGIRGLRTGGADWLRVSDGSIVASLIVQWGNIPGKRASIAAFRSVDGGYAWTFAGDIARADDPRVSSNEGPNENSLALLANGSVICVMRLDAGDAGRYHRYASSLSTDNGHAWTVATMLNGVGAARPRLLNLGSSLLLSGGRTWNKNRDSLVWLNAAGDGAQWLPYSLSYWHNTLITPHGNNTPRFDPVATNSSSHWPRESNSYTSLVQTGPTTAFVTYSFKGVYGFAMQIDLIE